MFAHKLWKIQKYVPYVTEIWPICQIDIFIEDLEDNPIIHYDTDVTYEKLHYSHCQIAFIKPRY